MNTPHICNRCENHKILDIAYYDEKLLSVLLVEDTDDQVPVLLQLPLNLISQDSFITMTATAGVTMATDMWVKTLQTKIFNFSTGFVCVICIWLIQRTLLF